MNFLLYIFFVYIHAQKNKMDIPCIVLLLGGVGGFFCLFFVCFVLLCFVLFCFFLRSITCNSHCATVIDSVFVSIFFYQIWPFLFASISEIFNSLISWI